MLSNRCGLLFDTDLNIFPPLHDFLFPLQESVVDKMAMVALYRSSDL